MRLMSDSVLHFSDNRSAALQEIVRSETGVGWRSSRAQWKGDRVAEALAALRTARLAAVLNEVFGLADCDECGRGGAAHMKA